jgi:hypothetical protein
VECAGRLSSGPSSKHEQRVNDPWSLIVLVRDVEERLLHVIRRVEQRPHA